MTRAFFAVEKQYLLGKRRLAYGTIGVASLVAGAAASALAFGSRLVLDALGAPLLIVVLVAATGLVVVGCVAVADATSLLREIEDIDQ